MKRIKRKICCEMMENNTTNHCSVHTNPFECPDCLIYIDKYNRYGIIIHDGGESFVLIDYCPWCGTKLPSVDPKKIKLPGLR